MPGFLNIFVIAECVIIGMSSIFYTSMVLCLALGALFPIASLMVIESQGCYHAASHTNVETV